MKKTIAVAAVLAGLTACGGSEPPKVIAGPECQAEAEAVRRVMEMREAAPHFPSLRIIEERRRAALAKCGRTS